MATAKQDLLFIVSFLDAAENIREALEEVDREIAIFRPGSNLEISTLRPAAQYYQTVNDLGREMTMFRLGLEPWNLDLKAQGSILENCEGLG